MTVEKRNFLFLMALKINLIKWCGSFIFFIFYFFLA